MEGIEQGTYLNTTAFRLFGQQGYDFYVMTIFFDADPATGVEINFPATGVLDRNKIKAIGCATAGERGLTYVSRPNGINYRVITLAEAAQFIFSLRDANENLVWENYPLGRICDNADVGGTRGNRANILACDIEFFTDTSFVKKTDATAIGTPYCIPFIFYYDKKR